MFFPTKPNKVNIYKCSALCAYALRLSSQLYDTVTIEEGGHGNGVQVFFMSRVSLFLSNLRTECQLINLNGFIQ